LHDDGFARHATAIVPFAFAAFALDWWQRRIGSALGEDDVEPWTWFCAQRGRQINAGEYLSAVEWIQSWTRRVVTWWDEGFDILVTPTVAFPPPLLPTVPAPDDVRRIGQRAGEIGAYTYPFNMTGQPAISLPLHDHIGLPIGVQLVAAPGREDNLVSIASQLERTQPWLEKRPITAAST
jgi:amidase